MATLSSLAQYVPLTQIEIPPAVYQCVQQPIFQIPSHASHRENLKFEKQISLPVAHRSNLFGVPLEDLMGVDGEKGAIPRVVKDCAQYIRSTGSSCRPAWNSSLTSLQA